MTKPTITREESIQAIFDLKAGHTLGLADIEILKRVARMALTAMDSETYCKERKLFCSTDTARMRKAISVSAGTDVAQLYRHAEPVPDEKSIFDAAIDACRKDDSITEHAWNHGVLAVQSHFNACRAAMLNRK